MSLLRTRSYSSAGFDAGGEWSVQFPRYEGLKCYAIESGECWLSVDGIAEPVRLQTGDCFLLPSERSFRVASDLTLSPVDFKAIASPPLNGGVISLNGGGDCFIVGGHFSLSGNHADILLSMLPPIVHLQTESDKAELRWSLERMRQELREPRPGGLLVVQDLAHMMLVQALRLHLSEGSKAGVGWLFALADKQMSAAISAIHGDPAHHWTLQKLAERAGMSRSPFAQKFRETVGTTPMEYVMRWRMLLAGDRLQNSNDSISAICLSLGYESESAFGKAFKRFMGCSPRQYGRARRPHPVAVRDDEDEQSQRKTTAPRLSHVERRVTVSVSPG